VFAVNFDDFVLKNLIEPANFYPYKDNGFAVFDRGDKKLKVFGNKFNKLFEITLKQGQGPGQLKNGFFSSVVFLKDKIIIVPGFEDKVSIFSEKGNFLKDVRFKKNIFGGCRIKDSLYLFANNINFEKDKTEVAYKVNLETGETEETIEVSGMKREQSELSKKLKGISVSGISTKATVTADGKIILVDTQGGRLFKIALNGKIEETVNLPVQQVMTMKKIEKNGSTMISLRAKTYFNTVREYKGGIYIGTMSNMDDDEKVTTTVYKIQKGKVEPIVNTKGRFAIIGFNNDSLCLFDDLEYQIKEIKL
jgi:hypothetical protein